MAETPPMFWMAALMWTITAAALLSKLDRLMLAVLVILLSALMLVLTLREGGPNSPAAPAIEPASPPFILRI